MAAPIALGALAERLRVGQHEMISIVGGGGKTTTMYALGSQVAGTAVLTTTTKMGHDQTGGRPVLLSPDDHELDGALAAHRSVVAWQRIDAQKAVGVDPATCNHWFDHADHVIIEADGSRRKPFKAPRALEPVIPSQTTLLLACIGADALGRVIADQCHRPLRIAAIAGCSPYERLTPARAAAVLRSERGSRKDQPAQARFAVVITKVDEEASALAAELTEILGNDTECVSVRMRPPTG